MLFADATLSILQNRATSRKSIFNYTRSKGFKLEQLSPFLVGAQLKKVFSHHAVILYELLQVPREK